MNNTDPSGMFFTLVGQLVTTAIQSILRGIDRVKNAAAALYMKATLTISVLMNQLAYGFQRFCNAVYHFVQQGGRFLMRLPQAFWQRLMSLFRQGLPRVSQIDAAQTGFDKPYKLIEAWRNMGASGHIHHIVQQTAANVARFGPRAIHSIKNSLPVPQSWHSGMIHSMTQSSTTTLGWASRYGHYSHLWQYIEKLSWDAQYRWGMAMYYYIVENGSLTGFDPSKYGL